MQEAETRTITLDNDDADGIDIMFVYLYTLEPPRSLSITDAEQCFLLGDKYALPALREAGYQQIMSSTECNV